MYSVALLWVGGLSWRLNQPQKKDCLRRRDKQGSNVDSDFWCLKGSQPLSHFCFVFVRCHENSDKDYFIPLFHGITSISPAVCSALLNCYDSPRIRLQHFSLHESRMRGCRVDARYQCDGEEGFPHGEHI